MPWYRYKDWITWPKEDVEEYAKEVALHYTLSADDTERLRFSMCLRRTNDTKERSSWQGPRKMRDTTIELHAQILTFEAGGIEPTDEQVRHAVWIENKHLNAPYDTPEMDEMSRSYRVTTVGDGLTRRQFVDMTGAYWRRDAIRQKYRWSPGDSPRKAFDFRRRDVERAMRELLWQNDYLTPNDNDWLCPEGSFKPYVGLLWYYDEVLKHLQKADRKRKQRMYEEALSLSFDAGSLFREMQIRAAHGAFYLKSEMTRDSQSEAGKGNKSTDDKYAIERWWFHRNAGHKRTIAGELAAADLGCSEPTIRRALGGSYPV